MSDPGSQSPQSPAFELSERHGASPMAQAAGGGPGYTQTLGVQRIISSTTTHESRGSARGTGLERELFEQMEAKNRLIEEKEEYITQQMERSTAMMDSLRESTSQSLRKKDQALKEMESRLQTYMLRIRELESAQEQAEMRYKQSLREINDDRAAGEEERVRRELQNREELQGMMDKQRAKFADVLENQKATHEGELKERGDQIHILQGQIEAKSQQILQLRNELRELRERTGEADRAAKEERRAVDLYRQAASDLESRNSNLLSERSELEGMVQRLRGSEQLSSQILRLADDEAYRRNNLMALAMDTLSMRRLEVLAMVHEITVRQYRTWLKVARDDSKLQKMYPYLGLEIAEELDREPRKMVDGVKVSMIRPGSPAEGADIWVEDLIQTVQVVHRSRVRDLHDFRVSMSKVRPGDTLTLQIVRDGALCTKDLIVQGTEADQHRDPLRRKITRSPANSPTVIGPPPE